MVRSRNHAGFTLLEAVLASALLAGAVAFLAHLVALAATQSSNNRHSLAALMAAQAKLEELRAADWSSVNVSPPRSLFEDNEGFRDVSDGDGTRYVRRWSIALLEPGTPILLVIQVCAYRAASLTEPRRPEACVAAVRVERP